MADERIFIVEDDSVCVQDIQGRLESLGYTVAGSAASGEEAFEQIAALRPDLILMDIHLDGGLDGIETAEQVQAQWNLPVIYLTAYLDPATVQRAKLTQPLGYLLKPIRTGDLATQIEIALYKHKTERELHHYRHQLEQVVAERTAELIKTNQQLQQEIIERTQVEAELQHHREHLEEFVLARIAELQAANRQLAQEIEERSRAEEALRKSEKRYRGIVEDRTELICRFLPDGTLTFVNEGYCRYFDKAPDELLGRSFRPLIPEEDRDKPAKLTASLSLRQPVATLEHRVIKPNGELGWQHWTNRAIFDKQDRIIEFQAVGMDITDRKHAEEEAATNLRRLQTVLETIEDGITLSDADGYFDIFNSKMEEITGYTRDEANTAENFLQLLYPESGEFQRALLGLQELQRMSGTHDVETTITAKDGSRKTLLVSTALIEDQEQLWFLSAYRDITRRKLIETEVLLLRNAINTATVGVTITTADHAILYVNPAQAALHGYMQAELIGRDARVFAPEDQLHAIDTPQLTSGWERETVNVRKDGTTFPVHSISAPVWDEAGTPAGVITISEDITDRKRVEAELRQAKEAAETASRAKTEFLANMSHDLRTPMNAVLGFAQLLARDPGLTSIQREYLDTITRSGEHLLMLINDILDMSKIEAGRLTLNRQTFDLRQMLTNLEEMMRIRAEKKGLELRVTHASGVPQYIVADEAKLRQVLVNLLSNAIKFTEHGSVILSILDLGFEILDSEKSKIKNLKFEIQDTGIGIASDEQETIFAAFAQACHAPACAEGTGLGLTISRRFVRLMGGEIQVQSAVGKGSTFRFTIPVEVSDQTVSANQPIANARRVIGLAPAQAIPRILVVDDDRDNRAFLVHLLGSVGFDVREAANGQEALNHYQSWQPHLIWMDMRMFGMDGYETTKAIRNYELRMKNEELQPVSDSQSLMLHSQFLIPNCKIIALTSLAFEEERTAILNSGCDDLVHKPAREYDIFETIRKHLLVHYRYAEGECEETPARHANGMNGGGLLTPADLAALPSDLLLRLKEAASYARVKMIEQAIDAIRRHDPVVAARLMTLASDFKYQEILTMIQSVKKGV